MRVIAIGLAAAMFAAALSPAAAFAAKAPPAPAGAGDAKSHAQGMTDVPALVTKTGINCTPTDANFLGQGKQKDASGKETTSKVYELVCQEGLGYMIMAAVDGSTASAFDCLAMTINKPKPGEADKGTTFCRLPANSDPLPGLQPLLAKAGAAGCTVNAGRYMGSSADGKLDQYELSCSNGGAYVLQNPRVGSPQKITAIDCLSLTSGQCEYLPKEKFITLLGTYATPANRSCQITDGRWMGALPSGDNFFELACSDEKAGYVLQLNAQKQYVKSFDCARATSIGGGCTLTAASAAQTEATGTYTQLAKQIGYPCNVKAYHSFGLDKQGREVAELSCSDRPDGIVGVLPVEKGQTGEYMNCMRAPKMGVTCALTPKQATFTTITGQLTAAGRHCTVTDAAFVGHVENGEDYIEVVCQEGGGEMVNYAAGSDKVKSVVGCGAAGGIAGGCKLTIIKK